MGLSVSTFNISCEVIPLGPNEPRSCWNEALGESVIVAGFPVPDRYQGEIGLELSLEIMAGLGAVALATEYGGGYVLKGRSVAFIPVERRGNSVQWHLIHQSGGRIRYQDIGNLCPHRLLTGKLDEKGLSSTRAFLGWCPNSINTIGTFCLQNHCFLI